MFVAGVALVVDLDDGSLAINEGGSSGNTPITIAASLVATTREESDWIRTLEAARYLGVHVETMRNWARKGVIPAARLGNRGGFRFKREDLERFLDARRNGLR